MRDYLCSGIDQPVVGRQIISPRWPSPYYSRLNSKPKRGSKETKKTNKLRREAESRVFSSLSRRGSSSRSSGGAGGAHILPAWRTLVVVSSPHRRLRGRAGHRLSDLGGGRIEGVQRSVCPPRHFAHLFFDAAFHGVAQRIGRKGSQQARRGAREHTVGGGGSPFFIAHGSKSSASLRPRADGQGGNHHVVHACIPPQAPGGLFSSK